MIVNEFSPSPKPVLLVVDDAADALRTVEHELSRRYGSDYQVVCAGSAQAGLQILHACTSASADVAIVFAAQWLAGMTGTEFLTRAQQLYPDAKRVLLATWGVWGDGRATEGIRQAMALGRIDYSVLTPWGSPDEAFHRIITEFLYDWRKSRRCGCEEIRVVGEWWSPRSHELRDLLKRNGVSHAFYAADSQEGQDLLAEVGHTRAQLPVVILVNGRVLVNPSNLEIAEAYGVNVRLRQWHFDVVIIGAGPAGLSAAVYAASEGLRTLVVEREAIGGQAGSSSLIRNYLGFPWGISGSELTARAYLQAWNFGATFLFGGQVIELQRRGGEIGLALADGSEVTSRAVIIATGVSYRRLEVPSLDALRGVGVFYGAASAEAHAMTGLDVYIVGGANSAGQAAMHLSKYARRVTLLVRGTSLSAGMSDYLIQEITAAENIAVRLNTQVVDGGGNGRLEYLVLKDSSSGRTETVPAAALFILIGARPHTSWLPETIERDSYGFVMTGRDLLRDGAVPAGWPLARLPLRFETSLPGVFAVGDVRHRSVKRVAAAVGEGSIAIQMIHEYLEASTDHMMPGAMDHDITSVEQAHVRELQLVS